MEGEARKVEGKELGTYEGENGDGMRTRRRNGAVSLTLSFCNR